MYKGYKKELRGRGEMIGREGLSERVIQLVTEYIDNDSSYKGAIILAGKLRAISYACEYDSYWGEKTQKGVCDEIRDIKKL